MQQEEKTMFGNIKRKWNRYLERLAAVNEKLYGQQRLDCCSMNHRVPNMADQTHQVHPSEKGQPYGN